MAADYPDSPTIGDTFSLDGTVREWDGDKWNIIGGATGGGGGGVTDHGALTGLADDDHPQYSQTTHDHDVDYEAAGAVTTHAGAADPHTGYQKESEKGAASGYASLDGSTKVPIAEVPTGATGTTVALGNHTHATGYATRATLSTTTASLANLATEDGTLALAAGYRLLKIDVNKACRVRVYNSSAQRTSDASRAIGQNIDIATDHGLVLEYVATAAIDAELSPTVDGYCPTGTDAYYAIENRSGSTGTVTVIFTWIRTE